MSDTIQDDFQRIRERLAVYYKRHEINLWLRSPHPLLNGRRACDLINTGNFAEVERVIDMLDSGAYL